MNYITICEDDCLFKSNFKTNYKIITDYLEKHMDEWDIMVGIVAAFSKTFHPTISKITVTSKELISG